MNQSTRERFAAGMAQLTEGIEAMEALCADEAADLLASERQALRNALTPLLERIGPIARIKHQAEQRAPGRGKVAAAPSAPEAPEEAAAAPAVAPPAPVAPVADQGVAVGLKALALAIRDHAMAVRDGADALRELAAARPQHLPPAPAAPAAPAAPVGAAQPWRRRTGPPPGLRSGAVAEALGVSLSTLHLRVKQAGGPQVGLTVGNWQVVEVSHGPGGRARLWWAEVEADQQAP